MLKVATILTSDTPCFYLNVKFFNIYESIISSILLNLA